MHFIFSTRYGASCMSESEWKITQNTHTHTSAQTRTCIDIHHGKRRILHCRTEKIFHFWGKIFCYPSSCCSYACMLFNALASQDDISIHRKKTGASMHLYWCGSTLLLFILRVKQWTTEMKRERSEKEMTKSMECCVFIRRHCLHLPVHFTRNTLHIMSSYIVIRIVVMPLFSHSLSWMHHKPVTDDLNVFLSKFNPFKCKLSKWSSFLSITSIHCRYWIHQNMNKNQSHLQALNALCFNWNQLSLFCV